MVSAGTHLELSALASQGWKGMKRREAEQKLDGLDLKPFEKRRRGEQWHFVLSIFSHIFCAPLFKSPGLFRQWEAPKEWGSGQKQVLNSWLTRSPWFTWLVKGRDDNWRDRRKGDPVVEWLPLPGSGWRIGVVSNPCHMSQWTLNREGKTKNKTLSLTFLPRPTNILTSQSSV